MIPFKFYSNLRVFHADNPGHFLAPILKRNPHFYDIECRNLILDRDTLIIDTQSGYARIEKDFIAYTEGVYYRENDGNSHLKNVQHLRRTKDNVLMVLNLCLG